MENTVQLSVIEAGKYIKEKSVLIVDDEIAIRQILSAIFRSCGAKIVEAESGNEAYALSEGRCFDLIVSDMRMAGGDGMALLSKVRSRDGSCPPFIFVTGATEHPEATIIRQGAQAVIGKPFSTKNVVIVAAKAMSESNCEPCRPNVV